jgi:hypothetical protein
MKLYKMAPNIKDIIYIPKICPFDANATNICGSWCPHFFYRASKTTAIEEMISDDKLNEKDKTYEVYITCSGREVLVHDSVKMA